MNVLIIPEDFRKDQYVLKPIVSAMLASLGKGNAKVHVLRDPLLGGIDKALNLETLRDVLKNLEKSLQRDLGAERCFIGECAHQEIEVWALAGADLPGDWRWKDIRAHLHPKEEYFEPFAKTRFITSEPGGGRLTLGSEAGARLKRLLQLCPELEHLADRISTFMEGDTAHGEPFDG